MNDRFDDAISAADEKRRKEMEQGSAMLLEAIKAAREGRKPGSPQFVFWGM